MNNKDYKIQYLDSPKVKLFFLLISLSYITAVDIVTTDAYLIAIFLITGFYFHFKGLKYDPLFILIIIFFLLINFASVVFYGMFSVNTLIGTILRLLIPYYILKILGDDFFIYLEKIIYFLAIISIPFYILQLIKPDIYLQLNPLFRFMMTDDRYNAQIFNYGFHTVHYLLLFRNSGFAWEPGGFGYVLGLAIMFNVVSNHFNFNKKSIILLLVGLTTFSTTFYIFFLVLLTFWIYERKRNITIIYFITPIIVFVSIIIIQLPFMQQKIDSQIKFQSKTSEKFLESTPSTGAGRFGGLIYEYKRFVEYPFGYGINTGGTGKNILGEYIAGPGGLGRFVRMWGIIGFLFLLYSLYSLSERLAFIYQNKNKIFVMITILLFLFSNPIERDPIFLMIVYYPLFVLTKKNTIINIYNNMITNPI